MQGVVCNIQHLEYYLRCVNKYWEMILRECGRATELLPKQTRTD